MVTAEVTFPRETLIHLEYPMQYVGLDWDTYIALSEDLGESTSLHLTFDKGDLTIVPVTELHEMLISLLQSFVTLAGLSLRIHIVPTGAATLRSKSQSIGVEPDLSYFVKSAGVHRLKDSVPNEVELPPDIVVEIDVFHDSQDKFEIYGKLGISEFWQYLEGKLRMFKIGADRRYAEIERSEQIPVLTSAVLTEFLERGRTENSFEILSDFQNWLDQAKPRQ